MSTAPTSQDRHPTAALTQGAHRSSGSFELVLAPVIMALLGLQLDYWVGTHPLFILLFTIWGALGAGALVYYRYRDQMNRLREARVESSAGGTGGEGGRR